MFLSSSSSSSSASTSSSSSSRTWSNSFPYQLIFVINFLVPHDDQNSNLILYFGLPRTKVKRVDPDGTIITSIGDGFDVLLNKFLNESEEWREGRLKLIPRVEEGNWVVKRGVGTRPAILGKKLTTKSYVGEGHTYVEVDIDVGSSKVATGILKLVKGYGASITIDLNFLLEGQDSAELPEKLIGGIRLKNIDVTHSQEATFFDFASANSS